MEPRDKSLEWSDEIPDEEEEPNYDEDPVYRDGSPKNECWAEK